MINLAPQGADDEPRLKRHKLRIATPGGRMEVVIDDPVAERKGLILIAHPHPLQGGSLDNKVVHTLARTATDHGYVAVRPNFRGVGLSEGEYDHGQGEVEDMLAIMEFVSNNYPELKWRLAGFSFGAFVQHQLAKRMETGRMEAGHTETDCVLLVAPAVNLYTFGAPASGVRMIHGDQDEVVPFADAQAWAAQFNVPLTVVPGAGHFFHGRLKDLSTLTTSLCQL